MGKMTTTQLAQYLNLSRSTVSKALNNHESVNVDTRRAVLKAAYQFGYIHSLSLPGEETIQKNGSFICLLVTDNILTNRFWNVAISGLEDYLLQNGYHTKKTVLENEDSALNKVLNIPVGSEGIIVIGRYSRQAYKHLQYFGIPVVSLDTSADTRGNNLVCDVVMMSNSSCTYEITSHMIRAGRKSIAFIGDKQSCLSIWERWQGYHQALLEYGAVIPSFNPLLKIPLCGDTTNTIYQILADAGSLPDACVCGNDALALNTFFALKKLNVSVPKDVMLSGFDNFDSAPMIRRFAADLTSVNFDIREIGRQAARQMLYRLESPTAPLGVYRVQSKVIYRASTEG